MNKTTIPPISFGVDYYPEHWPKERWAEGYQADEGDGDPGSAYGRVFLEPF